MTPLKIGIDFGKLKAGVTMKVTLAVFYLFMIETTNQEMNMYLLELQCPEH
jgi:hypothetical protein